MKIKNKSNESTLRKESIKNSMPIIDMLLQKIQHLSGMVKTNHTLYAVCLNSFNILKDTLRASNQANAFTLFAAMLSHMDIDRGYTGWKPFVLIRIINEACW